VSHSEGRILVVAAAGVNCDNADIIISGSGVGGVHAGSSVMTPTYNEDILSNRMKGGESNESNESMESCATMGTGCGSHIDDMTWDAADASKVARYVRSAEEGYSTYMRNSAILPAPLRSPEDCTDAPPGDTG
jgi:hypothetical protein